MISATGSPLRTPELAQPLGGAGDLVAELGVAGLAAEELERDVVGELGDRLGDQVGERAGRQLDVVGNALGVGRDPGAGRRLRYGGQPSGRDASLG